MSEASYFGQTHSKISNSLFADILAPISGSKIEFIRKYERMILLSQFKNESIQL